MKLQLSYEIMFGYVQKLQTAHLIPLKTIKFISYNKFSKFVNISHPGGWLITFGSGYFSPIIGCNFMA